MIACDLEADINILPLRDDTEVGEDGVLLSGGQRHRIAIARCLYSKASCTILDMPFCALDSNLGNDNNCVLTISTVTSVCPSIHSFELLGYTKWHP